MAMFIPRYSCPRPFLLDNTVCLINLQQSCPYLDPRHSLPPSLSALRSSHRLPLPLLLHNPLDLISIVLAP